MENLKQLILLYIRPGSAMSEVMDKGSWAFSILLVLIVSVVFFVTVNTKLHSVYRIPDLGEFYQPDYSNYNPESQAEEDAYEHSVSEYRHAMKIRQQPPLIGDLFFRFFTFAPTTFYQPLLSISLFYVPFLIFLLSVFGGVGRFGPVLQRDYGTLSVCSLMAWAAAHIPFALVGMLLYSQAVNPLAYLAMWAASGLIFGVFMVFAIRTVFGANFGLAAFAVAIGWIAFSFGMYFFQIVSPWLLSPFLIIFAVI
ncbi:MAG TPA: hypothetical protein VK612_12490, partial [Pyrinomonadaceae bacterium]|nr:hypothetical protein [Pyrinomonadaceae bacterium]